jgi:hypothetical protein
LGGNDVGLNARQFREIAEKLTKVETVPRKDIGGALGRMKPGPGPKEIASIRVAKELPERHMDRILGHELGHAVHRRAGLQPITDAAMRAELERNYSRFKTGIENPEKLTLPGDVHSKYRDSAISDQELVAEGYHSAFRYPDYAKKELPVAHATMRSWLKSKPELARLVINNSVAAATVAAALAAAGERDEAKAKSLRHKTRKEIPWAATALLLAHSFLLV